MEKKNTKKDRHLLSRQEKWIHFSPKEVKHLFFYYVGLLIVASLWLTFSVLYHYEVSPNGFSKYLGIIMFACPGGLLGSVIYYIRKLYKSCLQNLIDVPLVLDDEIRIKTIGAKMYFYLRPIISGILAIIMDMGILAGVYFVINQPNINDHTFYVFIVLVSFYIGFCNGKVIVNIEKRGSDIVNFIFKSQENKDDTSSQ